MSNLVRGNCKSEPEYTAFFRLQIRYTEHSRIECHVPHCRSLNEHSHLLFHSSLFFIFFSVWFLYTVHTHTHSVSKLVLDLWQTTWKIDYDKMSCCFFCPCTNARTFAIKQELTVFISQYRHRKEKKKTELYLIWRKCLKCFNEFFGQCSDMFKLFSFAHQKIRAMQKEMELKI